MNALVQHRLQFDEAVARDTPDEPLMLDLDVWEGPSFSSWRGRKRST